MDRLHTKDEIFSRIQAILVDLFEIEPDAVTLDASLVDDLDIDSIDAVDLLAELKDFTHKKVDPDDFKSVRTLADVVSVVEKMQSAYAESEQEAVGTNGDSHGNIDQQQAQNGA